MSALLDTLTVHLTSVFQRNSQILTKKLSEGGAGVTEQMRTQVRLLFAEDMVKKQFVRKTVEVLKEHYFDSRTIVHRDDIPGGPSAEHAQLSYELFVKWVKRFAGEDFVIRYMRLAETCAKHLLDPGANAPPRLDFSGELPTSMTESKLLCIFEKLWEI